MARAGEDVMPSVRKTPARAFLSALCLLVFALSGCKLIDQTTFGAKPEPPAPDLLAEALKPDSRIPLVDIRFDGSETAYGQELQRALEMAEARRPEAQYDVVAVAAAKGNADEQIKAADQASTAARAVIDQMIGFGINPSAIRLLARTEPGISVQEVRIYVR